ncbi:MAG: hypothetical protein U5O15_09925 [Candidatus Krumholzibacteriota bacterium]|nr:hypothetical protein [Candidatus Krumholzibacteriota bacterium]
MTNNNSKSTLSDQAWTEISIHHVYHSFLKGELGERNPHKMSEYHKIITTPDFKDPMENHLRFRLLIEVCGRKGLLAMIPCSTKWYQVEFLNEQHISELRVIGRCEWDSKTKSDKNEIEKVILREKEPLRTEPSNWDAPILWGHYKDGPFTIIEGNHRFVGWANAKERLDFSIPVFIGLSRDYCYWHILDDVPKSV